MSIPYFPLYVSDYEADTAHLTLEEDGAYLRLLRLCWRTPGCSIPDDAKWIMRKMRLSADDYYRIVEPLIDEFFTRGMDRVFNARLQREHDRISDMHKQRSEAGKASAKARALKTKEKNCNGTNFSLQQPEPEPEPEPEPDIRDTNVSLSKRENPNRFQEFWDAYPHRGGAKKGRKPSEQKYRAAIKAGTSEQEIIDGACRYQSDRGVMDGYAKNPETWLNQKGWDDEIEIANTQRGKPGLGKDTTLELIALAARRRPS